MKALNQWAFALLIAFWFIAKAPWHRPFSIEVSVESGFLFPLCLVAIPSYLKTKWHSIFTYSEPPALPGNCQGCGETLKAVKIGCFLKIRAQSTIFFILLEDAQHTRDLSLFELQLEMI